MRNWSDVLPASVATAQGQWERNQAIWRAYHEAGTCAEVARCVGLSSGRIAQIVARCERYKREGKRSPIERFLSRAEPYRKPEVRRPKLVRWWHFLHDQPGYGRRRQVRDQLSNELFYLPWAKYLYFQVPAPRKWQTTEEYADILCRWFNEQAEKHGAEHRANRRDVAASSPPQQAVSIPGCSNRAEDTVTSTW